MKVKQFISKIRRGDTRGTIVITIPQKTYRLNGLNLNQEYVFEIKEIG